MGNNPKIISGVYILQKVLKSKAHIGVTGNLSHRLAQHNHEAYGCNEAGYLGGKWRPVLAITGFDTHKEAENFEVLLRDRVQANITSRLELDECSGGTPKGVLRRILTARHLLSSEKDEAWEMRRTDRKYILYWMIDDELQLEQLRKRWGTKDRVVVHEDLDPDVLTQYKPAPRISGKKFVKYTKE